VVLVVETRERPLVLLLLLWFAFWSLWLVEAPLDVRLFKFVRLRQTASNKYQSHTFVQKFFFMCTRRRFDLIMLIIETSYDRHWYHWYR
jgi:hypothetical protein